MKNKTMFQTVLLCIVLIGCCASLKASEYQPLVTDNAALKDIGLFAEEMARNHGFEEKVIYEKLSTMRHRQDIIQRITKPAEGMPWHRYRKIWMKDKRIDAGVAFWKKHEKTLQRAQQVYGVAPEIIVGIIGVETFYGRIQGDFPVIEALHTLGFYYPKRAKFFRSELRQYYLLAREQGWALDKIKGSYAGAMGMGQFISSSYRAYGVDFDGDGQVNLFSDPVDMIGSVANYFKQHQWRKGGFVVKPVKLKSEQSALVQTELTLKHSPAVFKQAGVDISSLENKSKLAGIFAFELADGTFEHWLGGENFYSITRYNHNVMYALAVFQLSQAVTEKRERASSEVTSAKGQRLRHENQHLGSSK